MALTPEDVGRIARLAQLELSDAESARLHTELNEFFTLAQTMRTMDTSGVEPLAHPASLLREVALRLRDDVASEPDQREAFQRNAPAVADGLFLVPRVIE